MKPVALYNDPFRRDNNKLVLCDGYDSDGNQCLGYEREKANIIFEKCKKDKPWFGIEQEYTLFNIDGKTPYGWSKDLCPEPQGKYYCGVGSDKVAGRKIIEEHYKKSLYAGLKVSGINAEVMLGQWEYQIGPCEGISAGDQIWISRYIMERICEENDILVSWHPKPIKGDWNGSGSHTNFSSLAMREEGGEELFKSILNKLKINHKKHMDIYGDNNDERLTGNHETASIDVFTYVVANRGASIRIPRSVGLNWLGYIEDRRPASNMDPYLVTSTIANTTLLE